MPLPPKKSKTPDPASEENIIKLIGDNAVHHSDELNDVEEFDEILDDLEDETPTTKKTKLPTRKTDKQRHRQQNVEIEVLIDEDSNDDEASLSIVNDDKDEASLSIVGDEDVTLLENTEDFPRSKRLYPTFEKSLHVNEVNLAATPQAPLLAITDPEEQWRKAQSSQSTRRIPIGWLILSGLIALALGFTVFQQISTKGDDITNKQLEKARLLVEAEAKARDEDQKLYRKIHDTVNSFWAASSLDELLPHCRRAEEIKSKAENYYNEYGFTPRTLERISSIRPIALNGSQSQQVPFIIIQALVDGKTENILLEQIDDENILVDWESTVAYQPIPWDRYRKEKPTDPLEFRVHMVLDHHYTYEFNDEDLYQCFHLSTRESEQPLYGYLKRDHPRAAGIIKAFSSKTPLSREPAIITLRFIENGEARDSVLIEDFHQFGWTVFE